MCKAASPREAAAADGRIAEDQCARTDPTRAPRVICEQSRSDRQEWSRLREPCHPAPMTELYGSRSSSGRSVLSSTVLTADLSLDGAAKRKAMIPIPMTPPRIQIAARGHAPASQAFPRKSGVHQMIRQRKGMRRTSASVRRTKRRIGRSPGLVRQSQAATPGAFSKRIHTTPSATTTRTKRRLSIVR